MKKMLLLFVLATNIFCSSAQRKIGIGTNAPEQRLTVDSTMNVDHGNYDDGTKPSLKFGSLSGEGIGSRRYPNGVNGYGLDFWTNNTKRMIISHDGYIGIEGQYMPGYPLNFANTPGDKISLYGNSGNHYGMGIATNALQIHTDASSADILFGYGSSTSFSETMRIKGNGNVGIGTAAPGAGLHISRTGNLNNNESSDHPLKLSYLNETLYMGADYQNSASYIQAVGSNTFHTLALQGRGGGVAIGKAAATERLDVAGNIKTSGNVAADGAITVRSGKGMVRSSTGTQLKTVIINVDLSNQTFNAATAYFFEPAFESFSAAPAIMIGGVTFPAPGTASFLYEFKYDIIKTESNKCYLRVINDDSFYNYTTGSNVTLKLIAIGPE